jgi:D-alanyl-lipoteichoic acid acyltransferase DltB (MBOAT superfamily)
LAGPLERSSKFLAQLSPLRPVDPPAVRRGLALILMGLLRKVVIADTLLWLMPSDFSIVQSGNYSFLERAGWVLVFAFRLYNDFAGYTDIMRGLSLLLGIQLSPNFRQPFAARTLSDFWNRWHISLSGWLRDTIFFPLSRAMARRRKGAGWLRLVLPPLVTMLFSGFWHGATMAMLVWGGLHGLGLVFEQLGQRWSDRLPGWVGRWFFAPSLARTFAGTTFLWVLFAAGDLTWALNFYAALLPPYTALAPEAGWFWPLVLMAFSAGIDWAEDRQVFVRAADPLKALAIGAALVLVLLSIQTGQDVSGFVYQGF